MYAFYTKYKKKSLFYTLLQRDLSTWIVRGQDPQSFNHDGVRTPLELNRRLFIRSSIPGGSNTIFTIKGLNGRWFVPHNVCKERYFNNIQRMALYSILPKGKNAVYCLFMTVFHFFILKLKQFKMIYIINCRLSFTRVCTYTHIQHTD